MEKVGNGKQSADLLFGQYFSSCSQKNTKVHTASLRPVNQQSSQSTCDEESGLPDPTQLPGFLDRYVSFSKQDSFRTRSDTVPPDKGPMLTTCGQHHTAASRSGTASCIRTSQENVKAGASSEPDVPVRSGRTRGNPSQQITKVSAERPGLDDRTREWHMSRAGVASHIQAHRPVFPRRGAFVAPSLTIARRERQDLSPSQRKETLCAQRRARSRQIGPSTLPVPSDIRKQARVRTPKRP
ncbi:hypothetical protein CDEST_04619 [Colletotrichum destructivum]|uniref:Uncharacterized protein n=1 Tax=Colletotrichum destructivum TaxID=34406 RepID=A0AAX4I9E3_9PEZI|nr:hypothetical protein CDEST_04619 [Colletotrichum destructivum]